MVESLRRAWVERRKRLPDWVMKWFGITERAGEPMDADDVRRHDPWSRFYDRRWQDIEEDLDRLVFEDEHGVTPEEPETLEEWERNWR